MRACFCLFKPIIYRLALFNPPSHPLLNIKQFSYFDLEKRVIVYKVVWFFFIFQKRRGRQKVGESVREKPVARLEAEDLEEALATKNGLLVPISLLLHR